MVSSSKWNTPHIGRVWIWNYTQADIRGMHGPNHPKEYLHVRRDRRRLYLKWEGSSWTWYYYQTKKLRRRLWNYYNYSPRKMKDLYWMIHGFYQPLKDKSECPHCREPLTFNDTDKHNLCRWCQMEFRRLRWENREWERLNGLLKVEKELVTHINERKEYEGEEHDGT